MVRSEEEEEREEREKRSRRVGSVARRFFFFFLLCSDSERLDGDLRSPAKELEVYEIYLLQSLCTNEREVEGQESRELRGRTRGDRVERKVNQNSPIPLRTSDNSENEVVLAGRSFRTWTTSRSGALSCYPRLQEVRRILKDPSRVVEEGVLPFERRFLSLSSLLIARASLTLRTLSCYRYGLFVHKHIQDLDLLLNLAN